MSYDGDMSQEEEERAWQEGVDAADEDREPQPMGPDEEDDGINWR